ncbi:MAG: polysulfide reductase NrfD [Gammaproteobacteria bacterium]|nr:polysulfide reductase NrfD [Gammaproteobacteria bacterium]
MKHTPVYDNTPYTTLKPKSASYFLLLMVALVLAIAGLYAAYTMEHAGHHITGMNNHVVWGLPHVFAVSLIVAASGALNGASLSSVFGNDVYKPFARLSILLAVSLLLGGLMVLVLDLGRPDRLAVAMTHYNFRSIFTWNIFLYTGFIAISVLYLWVLMERRMNRYVRSVGSFAFAWRLILTTATGSIFGFLVGRNALDSALLAPLFIALSLVMGTAILALVLTTTLRWKKKTIESIVVESLEKLLLWFLLALLYFSVVHHLTNLYAAEHRASERFTLTGGLAGIFWLGHVVMGLLVPIGIIVLAAIKTAVHRLLAVSILALLGGGTLVYAIIIGSQSTPQRLFPGHIIVASEFGDAGFDVYSATIWEWGLGIAGVAVAILIYTLSMRVLASMPEQTSSLNG